MVKSSLRSTSINGVGFFFHTYHRRLTTVALSSFSVAGRDEYQIEKSSLDEYGWRGEQQWRINVRPDEYKKKHPPRGKRKVVGGVNPLHSDAH